MRREAVVGVLAMMMVLVLVAETRYLPTRAQDDKLLRLRQLLRDVSVLNILSGSISCD